MRWDIFQWDVFSHQICQFALQCLLACLIPPKQNTLFILYTFDVKYSTIERLVISLKIRIRYMRVRYLRVPLYESTVYESTVYEKFINEKWLNERILCNRRNHLLLK